MSPFLPEHKHKLAIVIPTIGRYDELRKMLQSLAAQTRLPEQVIIVDQDEASQCLVEDFPQLHGSVIPLPGSACRKRNAGCKATWSVADLIAFMDDDIVLEPGAIEAMLRFWDSASSDVGGASCNLANHPEVYARRLKSLSLVERLGLYGSGKGDVLKSGFQTMMPGITEDTYVRWLSSMAVVFRREVLAEFSFDEWFESYSYLEDLDLSYRVGKKYKLVVVADARMHHFPSTAGRPNLYLFGKKEILNRLHFVYKHPEFSRRACYSGLLVRMGMSVFLGLRHLDSGYLKRVAGNFAGIFLTFAS